MSRLTAFPGRLEIASDYKNLAMALLRGTCAEPQSIRLEVPQPYEIRLIVEHENPIAALAAAKLLKEFWLYDWMPCVARIEFLAAAQAHGAC